MTTITEDYVSFEVAKLLKEKGFKGQGEHFYENNKIIPYINYWNKITPKQRYGAIEAPTLQMVMKWLREVHNIHIDICSIWDATHWIYQVFVITPRTARNSYVDKILYTSYEQAVEAGIKYCLENLI